MQRDLRDKEEELERIKTMIRDKRIEHKSKDTFGIEEDNDQYQKLSKEIDSVKIMILDLRAN